MGLENLTVIWKPVKGYEGKYEVSTWGEVRSLTRLVKSCIGWRIQRGRLLADHDNGNGYRTVPLSKNSRTTQHYVHRLVATAFIPNPYNKKHVNHKNGKKWINGFWNLEWATQSENELHSVRIGLNDRAYTRKPVIQSTVSGEFVAKYPSVTEAAKATGICRSSIAECCVPPQKKRTYLRHEAGGFKWAYPQL